ncbi:hypothetical protein CRM22_003967 [Opisthorchis felineus]|uniref:Uncharacterized protein n=1 Tax=Opisthorchis felineus TaxID=147828 RepID=A0A4S2LYK0_OPIFE|nr:hypothetical protein CRM22_003967 [Opisthorchis felineus]
MPWHTKLTRKAVVSYEQQSDGSSCERLRTIAYKQHIRASLLCPSELCRAVGVCVYVELHDLETPENKQLFSAKWQRLCCFKSCKSLNDFPHSSHGGFVRFRLWDA